MAKITFSGLEEYTDKLRELGRQADGIVKMGIYDGAKTVTDAIRAEIEAIPEIDEYVLHESGLTKRQKEGLLAGLGTAKMQEQNGALNTKVGIAGYNGVKTKKYPEGQPNALIARTVLKGNSYRLRNDFIGRAVRKSRKNAVREMQVTIEAEIEKRMK